MDPPFKNSDSDWKSKQNQNHKKTPRLNKIILNKLN